MHLEENSEPSIGSSRCGPAPCARSSIAQCTGTLVGPRHVLTAAHCVVAPDRWTFVEEVSGYKADKPPGTLWTVRCPDVRFDFEGTELEDCGRACDNMVIHNCVSWEGQSGSAMWQVKDDSVRSGTLAAGGGNRSAAPAPVSAASKDNNTIRAVLTGVVVLQDGTSLNVGTELNAFVYGTLAAWYSEDVQPQARLEVVPPGPGDGHAPPTAVSSVEPSGGSWLSNHVYVPIVASLMVLALLGAACSLCLLPMLGINLLLNRARAP
ncbi:hypothetical protein TSOC_009873 [Tetrabaena socialis]|uniref:Peptidase S1 domain-containing protein n=1 Tax=Tetrabaena socialis TaxID=47790 RepID=A0A2J7ZUS5_9CHLO|nr:hypothetical protein TSOC_009873 [Tetrabaena socialis]|eukprot:PNH04012.1 hypothetical protein TSOC_009873 [Tetrabaena socialis]